LPNSESFLKFINIYDKALNHATKIETVFKIIEDREKFIDSQISIIKDPIHIVMFGAEKIKGLAA